MVWFVLAMVLVLCLFWCDMGFVFEMVLVSVHPVCLWVASAAINGVRLLRCLEVVFWG